MSMDYLPIAIRIASANIVIVGGGKVATHKAHILSRFTDHATVIAPEITDELKTLPFKIIEKEFEPEDLEGADILFVCTGNHELNHKIKALAAERKIITSVCDDPEQCDFISPAIFRDGNLTIACNSDSKDVRRSIRVRNRIRELIEKGILDIT
jgi:precorrin-2 dehydrogenase/sirohydrochlorin ferrochelatase